MENLEMNFRVEIGGEGYGSGFDVDKATFIKDANVGEDLAGELIGGFFTKHEQEESLRVMFFKRNRQVTNNTDLSRVHYVQNIDLHINAMRNDDYLDLVRSDVNLQRLDLIVNQYGAMLNHFNCGAGDSLDSAFSVILGESVYNQKPSIQTIIDVPLLTIELPCCIEPGIQIPSELLNGDEGSDHLKFKPEDLSNEYGISLIACNHSKDSVFMKVEISSTQYLKGHISNERLVRNWTGPTFWDIFKELIETIEELEEEFKNPSDFESPEFSAGEKFSKIFDLTRGVNVLRELSVLKAMIKEKEKNP